MQKTKNIRPRVSFGKGSQGTNFVTKFKILNYTNQKLKTILKKIYNIKYKSFSVSFAFALAVKYNNSTEYTHVFVYLEISSNISCSGITSSLRQFCPEIVFDSESLCPATTFLRPLSFSSEKLIKFFVGLENRSLKPEKFLGLLDLLYRNLGLSIIVDTYNSKPIYIKDSAKDLTFEGMAYGICRHKGLAIRQYKDIIELLNKRDLLKYYSLEKIEQAYNLALNGKTQFSKLKFSEFDTYLKVVEQQNNEN